MVREDVHRPRVLTGIAAAPHRQGCARCEPLAVATPPLPPHPARRQSGASLRVSCSEPPPLRALAPPPRKALDDSRDHSRLEA